MEIIDFTRGWKPLPQTEREKVKC